MSVSEAGGMGMIGAIMASDLEKELSIAAETLRSSSLASRAENNGLLPIGVGLLPFVADIDAVLPLLKQHQPAMVWLFAAKTLGDYSVLTRRVREACPQTKIWIQVGGMGAALTVAQQSKPDALVLQGSDAGGHGFERGASIVSLVPETLDTLAAHGLGALPVLASGGIADARGAAAAFTLGASGVVLGTRFLAARECNAPPGYRALVLATSDGPQNTVRSKLFDNVRGPNIWPEEYDGRSLVTESYVDFATRSVAIDEVRERHNHAVKGEDAGYGATNRANVWAGASVGLVRQMQDAKEIVEEVSSGIRHVLEGTLSRTVL